ncbi:MAG: hypothetical protein RR990_07865 [Lachnospiraceae bacterium]
MSRQKSYFEGWYLKQQNEHEAVAIIPAFHTDEDGKRTATVQVITKKESYVSYYQEEECSINDMPWEVRIGPNRFSFHGCHLELCVKGIKIEGDITYHSFSPSAPPMMGPFAKAPYMPCRHELYSAFHNVVGRLDINDRILRFFDGIGYIEGDAGTSFPEQYVWTQCGFANERLQNIMMAVARIPLWKIGEKRKGSYTGCIGSFLYEGTQYRIATYLGAKVRQIANNHVCIQQGKLLLHIWLLEYEQRKALLAPIRGTMIRTIEESVDSTVRYRCSIGGRVLFDKTGRCAGFEWEWK